MQNCTPDFKTTCNTLIIIAEWLQPRSKVAQHPRNAGQELQNGQGRSFYVAGLHDENFDKTSTGIEEAVVIDEGGSAKLKDHLAGRRAWGARHRALGDAADSAKTGLIGVKKTLWDTAFEGSVRDAFDHWLADFPSHASKLLDFTVDRAEERLRRRADNEFVLHLNSFLHLKKASRFDSLFVFCILMLIFLLPRDASRLPERAQSQHRHVLVCRFQLRH
jgi:hypothetical protein